MYNREAIRRKLLLDPEDVLRFYGEYSEDHQPTTQLVLTNPTPYSVHFKVITTASSRYSITPKTGLLSPNCQETIIISMTAPRGGQTDRFKVLALIAPNSAEDSTDVWEDVNFTRAAVGELVAAFVDVTVEVRGTAPGASVVSKWGETSKRSGEITSPERMLILDPKDEIRFYGEYKADNQPKTELVLTNPTQYSIHFKILTTSATRYSITPSTGLLSPYSKETIIISMTAPRGPQADQFTVLAVVAEDSSGPVDVWEKADWYRSQIGHIVTVFVD